MDEFEEWLGKQDGAIGVLRRGRLEMQATLRALRGEQRTVERYLERHCPLPRADWEKELRMIRDARRPRLAEERRSRWRMLEGYRRKGWLGEAWVRWWEWRRLRRHLRKTEERL